jgi:hypothetical protein
MYPIIPIRETHILLPQLIIQTMLLIQGAFHMKLICGNATYFSTHGSSSKFFQVEKFKA